MSLYESSRKMTIKEQECYELGYLQGKADATLKSSWEFVNCDENNTPVTIDEAISAWNHRISSANAEW